jgi:hypothetical protein
MFCRNTKDHSVEKGQQLESPQLSIADRRDHEIAAIHALATNLEAAGTPTARFEHRWRFSYYKPGDA